MDWDYLDEKERVLRLAEDIADNTRGPLAEAAMRYMNAQALEELDD